MRKASLATPRTERATSDLPANRGRRAHAGALAGGGSRSSSPRQARPRRADPGYAHPDTAAPTGPRAAVRTAMPTELTYSWAAGSDSEFVYRRNADLDKRLRDNDSFSAPTLFGLFAYRPVPWLSTRVEPTLETPMT